MRARLPVLTLVAWTLFVWVTRINNIWQDDDLDGFAMAWRLGAAVVFVVLALAVLITSLRAPERFVATLVGWTIAWWLVRGVGILLDDHDTGFKIVHTALMVASIGVAMWAWRRRRG